MQHLHRDGIGGEARDHRNSGCKSPGWAFIFKVGEEIERRVAGGDCNSSRHMAWRNNLIAL